jgi:hypothetical protein
MGAFYPTAAYCTKAVFERGGLKGSFKRAHLPA